MHTVEYATLALQAITLIAVAWLNERWKRNFSVSFEALKARQNLQTQAYIDFIKGVAGLGIAQRNEDASTEAEFSILLTDAKARIAIYGSRTVLEKLGTFFERYGALNSGPAMLTFLDAIQQMRRESVDASEREAIASISQLLFSTSSPSSFEGRSVEPSDVG